MRRSLVVLATFLAIGACSDPGGSGGAALCEYANELTAERPASYVGSEAHVEDVRGLVERVPADLQADAEHFLEFLEAGIDDPDTDSWPADVQAAVDELKTGLEQRCR